MSASTTVNAKLSAPLTKGLVPRIAFVGASGGAQDNLLGDAYPEQFRVLLRASSAIDCEIKNLAYNGLTFFTTNTTAIYGTNTMVTEVLQWQPDIVFVSLGYNDTVAFSDSRTLAQVKTDSDTTFSALRAGLPNALIIYISELGYDSTNFTSANLKNKGMVPYSMERPSAGITAFCYGSEMLETVVTAGLRGHVQDWIDLDTYIRANAFINATVVGPFWKCARLGLLTTDGGHFNWHGHRFVAASLVKQLKSVSVFTNLFPRMSTQTVTGWQDPDVAFAFYLTASGDGYVRATGIEVPGYNTEGAQVFWGQAHMICPEEWYLPYHTRVQFYPPLPATIRNTPDVTNYILTRYQNGPPGTPVSLSINGGAFAAQATDVTDTNGDLITIGYLGSLGLANGAYVLRYKLSNEIYGPFTVTLATGLADVFDVTASNTTSFTATGAQVAGGKDVTLRLTGVLASGQNITLPTAAAIVAAIPGATVGMSYPLRIINTSGGAFSWTVVTNTGLTLTGTLTIAQNTFRDFYVTLTSLTAVTVTARGVGTA